MPLLVEETFLLANALLNGGAFVMLRRTVKELRAIYNMQRRIERQGEYVLNPMGGYRDRIPYPHLWSRDIAAGPTRRLAVIEFLWPGLDKWTYGKHWKDVNLNSGSLADNYIVDLYWKDDGEERLQLPKDVGDPVFQLLATEHASYIRAMHWWGRYWTPSRGFRIHGGAQGTFVDHIHIEWRSNVTYPL